MSKLPPKFHETPCPWCGTINDCHAKPETLEFSKIEEGAGSMCSTCGQWSVFTRDLQLRKMTPEELGDAIKDPLLRQGIADAMRLFLLTRIKHKN